MSRPKDPFPEWAYGLCLVIMGGTIFGLTTLIVATIPGVNLPIAFWISVAAMVVCLYGIYLALRKWLVDIRITSSLRRKWRVQ